MSFVTLVNKGELSLSTDQLVIPATEVNALTNAIDVCDQLHMLLSTRKERLLEAEKQGFDEGFKQGLEEGLENGRADVAEQLSLIHAKAAGQQDKMKQSVVTLAMQVVRKIADDIGPANMVAAMAKKAVDELVSHSLLILHVHPCAVDAVKSRLNIAEHDSHDEPTTTDKIDVAANSSARALHIEVRSEASLSAQDCLIETEFGTTVASLDEQLRCLDDIIRRKLSSRTPAANGKATGGGITQPVSTDSVATEMIE